VATTSLSPPGLNSSPANTKKLRFRPDIQGLRAIAVISVVLYHAGVPALPGGYVGVDIFFVISGFLIIGLLWREIETTGQIHLWKFYARRIRRLLPAATVVALSILVATRLIMPPLTFTNIAREGLATSVFLVNVLFARNETQYSGNPSPSPFQHYWSLNVEEQFYVLLPLLLIACWWAFRRNRRAGFLATLVALSVVSFAACVLLMPAYYSWAFFSLPTRAWEMALGGVLALSLPLLSRVSTTAKTVLSGAGLLAIVGSIVAFSDDTLFPGWMTLLPVLGTLAVIAGGANESNPMNRALGGTGFGFVGNISYSLYLWHWPLLIIPAAALGDGINGWGKVVAVVAAFILAAVTYRLVELPFKRSRYLTYNGRRTYVFGAALVIVTLVASVGVSPMPQLESTKSTEPFSESDSGTVPVVADYVPANVTPTLVEASSDVPAIYSNGCQLETAELKIDNCLFGDSTSNRKVVLFGDSHAAHWFSAVEAAATAESMGFVSITKSGCPAVQLDVYAPMRQAYPECNEWRDSAISEINRINPEVILIASYAAGYEDRVDYDGLFASTWEAALSTTISLLPKTSKVIVLGETPLWNQSPTECLSANVENASVCAKPVETLVRPDLIAAEESAAASAGAVYVPTTPWLCTDVCSPLGWNIMAYRDRHHLTNTMSQTLQKPIQELLK